VGFEGKLTRWNNDDTEEDDDTGDQAHSHLHILPPHLLPGDKLEASLWEIWYSYLSHSVGAAAESLSGHRQVVGLVLQGIESFTTLGDLVDILSHNTDCVIDLLVNPLASSFPSNIFVHPAWCSGALLDAVVSR
jgi:hypothetical protein